MNSFKALLLGNLVGKVVGVAREILLAATYGTGPVAAAYRLAQTATLTPINFFTADALSAGFLPEHAQRLERDVVRARQYYTVVSRLLIMVSFGVALALFILRGQWVELLGPGLDAGVARLATTMLIVMAVGVPFYVSTALGSYVALSHGRYHLAAARPTVQSCGLIAGTAAAFLLGMPVLLAVGFTTSYVALAAWTFVELRRIDAVTSSALSRTDLRQDLGVFWRRLRPMLIAPLFLQGSWAVERSVATLIGLDAVAAVDYARLITDTVVVTIAGPLGLSLLVPLSRMSAGEARADVRRLMHEFMAVFVPVSTVLFAGALPIVSLVFERGEFDAASTEATSQILRGLAVGLFAMGLATVLLKALNGVGLNQHAAVGLAVGCAAMVCFDLLAYPWLGALALGLGAALAGIIQVIWFATVLRCSRDLGHSVVLNLPHYGVAIAALVLVAETDLPAIWAPIFAALGSLGWVAVCRPLRRSAIAAVGRLRG